MEEERTDCKLIKEECDETIDANYELQEKLADRDKVIAELRSELADLKQKSASARELPDAHDLLNQLKTKRKKSKTDLADIEEILAMIEES